MNMPVTYLLYLSISAALTIWVAKTLHRRGRIFLVHTFRNDESLADSVNDLLVVGFYLVNFGYVLLAMRFGDKPVNLEGAIEYLATKIGLVMVILGGMHFFNLYAFEKWRKWHTAKNHVLETGNPFATDFGRLREVAGRSRFTN